MQMHATKQITKSKPYTFTQYLQRVNMYKPITTSLSKATSDIIESNALSNDHIDSVVFTNEQGTEQKCTFYEFLDAATTIPATSKDIQTTLIVIGQGGGWWLERETQDNTWLVKRGYINSADYKWAAWPPTPSELLTS